PEHGVHRGGVRGRPPRDPAPPTVGRRGRSRRGRGAHRRLLRRADQQGSRMSLRVTVVTLFPELFAALEVGLLGKAIEGGHLTTDFVNPREFATDKHRTVDDAPYGGGSGM